MPISRSGSLLLPSLAMGLVVYVSNVAVQFPINDWLTWGAFTYPLAFFVNDVSNRTLGPSPTRQAIYVGFLLGVVLSILGADMRIGLASGTAFLLAQFFDYAVFNRLRRQAWWKAPVVSSVLGSALDTVLFFSLAFAGTGLPWIGWAVGDYAVKLVMAALLLGPYRLVVRWRPVGWQVKALPETGLQDL